MYRRKAMLAIAPALLVLQTEADAFVPLLLRILLGVGVRGTATVGARAIASRAVTMSVTRAGVARTMQVVTTREIGISIAGVVALSVTAAEVVAQYDIKAICVREIDKFATVVADNILINPTQLTVNIFNSVSSMLEKTVPIYANAGRKEFEFELPWETGRYVRRFDGSANSDSSVKKFTSGNVLFTSVEDVIYEKK